MTSHAAVVMRGMGKPAVTGASKLTMRAVPKEKAESAQVAAEGKSSEKAEVMKKFFHWRVESLGSLNVFR